MKPLASILSIFFLVFVAACIPQQPGAHTTPTQYLTRPTDSPEVTYQPRFEATECWGPVPAGVSATCGFVIVPENRSVPLTEDNAVRLAVIVLHAPHVKYTQPPTFLLGGGPGGDVVGVYEGLFRKYQFLQENGFPAELYSGQLQDMQQFVAVLDLFVRDLQKREFVYFDQRGGKIGP